MDSDRTHFEAFMKRREQAAAAYVVGDPAPLAALLVDDGDASFFAPMGGRVVGAADVRARYDADAAAFDVGSTTRFEILQLAANDGLAWWVGLQHAQVRFKGKAEPVPMALRITELFRRDGDDWRLVHRHADGLAEPKPRS